MSTVGNQPVTSGPSVFISYASEDRIAARALRDFLSQAGLEVWYDENELGGGDSWDQKIRRQIRDCEYFMPVISAATERRKEGYFRREWRLACERTLDMADDVLFLLPIAIDQTSETGARVPEKFLSVQWLRAPHGQPTPSLEALTRRLLAGEHHALPRPATMARTPLVPPHLVNTTMAPWSVPPSSNTPPTAGAAVPPPLSPPPTGHDAPPPMPAFPHAPETGGVGQWLKFFAEILWWVVTATWLLLTRMPKWARILVVAWLLFGVIGTCSRTSNSRDRDRGDGPPRSRKTNSPASPAVPEPASPKITIAGEEINIRDAMETARRAIADATAAAAKEGKGAPDFNRMGAEMSRRFGKSALDPNAAGKPLVMVPFSAEAGDAEGGKLAAAVFAAATEKLLAARAGEAAVTFVSLGNSSDESLTALGRNLSARTILGARVTTVENVPVLAVRLVRLPAGSIAWTEDFPLADADIATIATKIADGVAAAAPPRKAAAPGSPP